MPSIRLVAFDMEGVLTADPTVWELMHRRCGTWESHGLPYWERYLAGGLPYDEFARMDAAVWAGSPVAELEAAAQDVPLMPGCAKLLEALHDSGAYVVIISNGLARAAERFRRDFGAQRIFANRAQEVDGVLTGELDLQMPYEGKGDVLRALAAELGFTPDETAAVGDSRSDVAMFRHARISVAFGACSEEVAAAATHVVRNGSLLPLTQILLG
jgi:phosphoserine phosphatase